MRCQSGTAKVSCLEQRKLQKEQGNYAKVSGKGKCCLRSAERWKDRGADKESYYEHGWGL